MKDNVISIVDLGLKAEQMLLSWKKYESQRVIIKEFPTIDFYQKIEDKTLMEVVLEYIRQVEMYNRQLAKQRQARGIEEARKKGIKIGRREKKIPENFKDIYAQVIEKKITIKKATEILDIDYKTYRKWKNQYINK